jgi:hypothetical protein
VLSSTGMSNGIAGNRKVDEKFSDSSVGAVYDRAFFPPGHRNARS